MSNGCVLTPVIFYALCFLLHQVHINEECVEPKLEQLFLKERGRKGEGRGEEGREKEGGRKEGRRKGGERKGGGREGGGKEEGGEKKGRGGGKVGEKGGG